MSDPEVVVRLLAAIDEAEQDANDAHVFGCSSADPCYEPPYEAAPDYSRCDCRQAAVLRLCQSHRDIVNRYTGALFTQSCHPEYEANNGYVEAMAAVVGALARGYGVEDGK